MMMPSRSAHGEMFITAMSKIVKAASATMAPAST